MEDYQQNLFALLVTTLAATGLGLALDRLTDGEVPHVFYFILMLLSIGVLVFFAWGKDFQTALWIAMLIFIFWVVLVLFIIFYSESRPFSKYVDARFSLNRSTSTPQNNLHSTPRQEIEQRKNLDITDITYLVNVSATSYSPPSNDACTPPHKTTFVPQNIIDGKLDTAWRVNGNGSNSLLQFVFRTPVVIKEIRVVPGYAKKDPCIPTLDWCYRNHIPKTVRINASTYSGVFKLTKVCKWQVIHIPDIETSEVSITIIDIYPGSDRNYTPISEIKFFGYERGGS